MGWRVAGKTVKITNNIVTLCLTPVFMSCREIKEVFTEFGFHMSARAGRISEDQLQSGQAPVSAASADFVNDWGGRKETEAFIVDRAWFELIIVTISSPQSQQEILSIGKKTGWRGFESDSRLKQKTYCHSPPGSEGRWNWNIFSFTLRGALCHTWQPLFQ